MKNKLIAFILLFSILLPVGTSEIYASGNPTDSFLSIPMETSLGEADHAHDGADPYSDSEPTDSDPDVSPDEPVQEGPIGSEAGGDEAPGDPADTEADETNPDDTDSAEPETDPGAAPEFPVEASEEPGTQDPSESEITVPSDGPAGDSDFVPEADEAIEGSQTDPINPPEETPPGSSDPEKVIETPIDIGKVPGLDNAVISPLADNDIKDREWTLEDFSEIEKETFTKGLLDNKNIRYLGLQLIDYLFSLKNKSFVLAVNQLDMDQAGSMNRLVDLDQGAAIGDAMLHTGFKTYDFVSFSRMRTMALSNVLSEPEWPNQGAIYLDKRAKYLSDNSWEMQLEIKGMDFEASNDIVMVFDNSNNVGEQDLRAEKIAAIAFGEEILKSGSTARIKVVRFAGTILETTEYFTADTLQGFITFIEGISQEGGLGSNLQAGIHKAHELLYAGDLDHQKYMVILGNGHPTFSFPFVGSMTADTCTANHNNGSPTQKGIVISDPAWSDPLIPDYGTTIGSGSQFTMDYNAYVDVTCQHGYTVRYAYGNFDVNESFVLSTGTNNGVGAIWEANRSKEAGTNVFSIAFNAGTDGENVLKAVASSPSNYYSVTKSGDIPIALANAFGSIASKVSIAAKDGAVTDPMGDLVDLEFSGTMPTVTDQLTKFESGAADIYISQGSVTFDITTETITWDTGNINESEPAVMRYRIILEPAATVTPGQEIIPNGTTVFDYTNYAGDPVSREFEVPKVMVGGGTVQIISYRVNELGQPVNSEGVAVPLENAQRFETTTETKIFGTYQYTAQDIPGYVYYGYILNEGTMTAAMNTVQVKISEDLSNNRLWFGYYPGRTRLKINKSGSSGEHQSFMFQVKGISTGATDLIDLTVTVQGDGSIEIQDLPLGEYEITELTGWSWRYTPVQTVINVTTTTAKTEAVTFENKRTGSKWLSGDSWIRNIFKRFAN